LVVAIRPENVKASVTQPAQSDVALLGQVGDIAFQGQYSIVEILLEGRDSLTAIVQNGEAQVLHAAGQGSPVWAHWSAANMLLLPTSLTNGSNQ